MKKIYISNGIFSKADRIYNNFLANEIRNRFSNVNIYLPHEIVDNQCKDSIKIFENLNSFLDDSDILVVVIDMVEVNAMVGAEIGRFVSLIESSEDEKKRYIIGFYADDKYENEYKWNKYLIGAILSHGNVVNSIDGLLKELEKHIGHN